MNLVLENSYVLFMSGKISLYILFSIYFAIYLLIRGLSLVLGDCIISKRFTFRVISLKLILLLILWDIIWGMLLVILATEFTGVYTDNTVIIISIIFYIFVWIIETMFILPWVFKKRFDFDYITNKKLNLFIMSFIHRIIFFKLLLIFSPYMYRLLLCM